MCFVLSSRWSTNFIKITRTFGLLILIQWRRRRRLLFADRIVFHELREDKSGFAVLQVEKYNINGHSYSLYIETNKIVYYIKLK